MQNLSTLIAKMKKMAEVNQGPIDCSKFDWKVGTYVRQGDVLIVRLAKPSHNGIAVTNPQLAPGKTVGARHVVELGEHCKLFKAPDYQSPLGVPVQVGPQIVATSKWNLNHPTHDSVIHAPAGAYQVLYEIDPNTQQRQLD
jgi:hypothetical protein